MRVLRVLFGIVLGGVLAAGLLRALAFAAPELGQAIADLDQADIQRGALWMAAIGVGLGIIMMVGRSDPAVPTVCALGVLAVVGPAFLNLDFPTWLPTWILPEPQLVLSPISPLIAGALVLAAAWGIGSKARGGDGGDDDRVPADDTADSFEALR